MKNLLILMFALAIYSCSTTSNNQEDELVEDTGTFIYRSAGDVSR